VPAHRPQPHDEQHGQHHRSCSRVPQLELVAAEKEGWTVISMKTDWTAVFEPPGT
jgi:hypothetical protein